MTALKWRKVDDYHVRSYCGGFSVSRVNIAPRIWYIAWKRSPIDDGPAEELGSVGLLEPASDDARLQAIRDMQKLCEERA